VLGFRNDVLRSDGTFVYIKLEEQKLKLVLILLSLIYSVSLLFIAFD